MKLFRICLLIGLGSLLLACAATATRESTGEYLDSAAITAKVKAELVDTLGTSGFAIKVKTYKDEVQLSGFVDNESIRQRAAAIAADTPDVRLVRNSIVVKSKAH